MKRWPVRAAARLVRLVVRRRNWGPPAALAKRARSQFRFRRLVRRPVPADINLTLVADTGAGIHGEWVAPQRDDGRIMLYLHGGGYVACSALSHRAVTIAFARLTPARVFALDYPLAPEYPYPAGLDNAVGAYRWLLAQGVQPSRLAVAGDSAGGGMALALMLRLRDERVPLPSCAVLFYPWTDQAGTSEASLENAGRCDMFWPDNLTQFADCYAPPELRRHPYVSPLFGDLGGLPPIHLQVGEREMLKQDAVRVHEKVLAAGGVSDLRIFPDVFHGWHLADGFLAPSREALTIAAAFVRAHTP